MSRPHLSGFDDLLYDDADLDADDEEWISRMLVDGEGMTEDGGGEDDQFPQYDDEESD